MAKPRRPTTPPTEPALTPEHIENAIARFRRRLADLEKFDPDVIRDRSDPSITTLEVAIEEALAEAFGRGTPAYKNYSDAITLDRAGLNIYGIPLPEIIEGLRRGKARSIALLNQAIASLHEKLAEMGESRANDPDARTLRAYEGLDLHSEIARAASQLYKDGHYANAVEDSVKALNALVRLRSGLEVDGVPLMQQAFSSKKPILKFNDLSDQSDHDEQLGFMNLFSGAVSGLRNPRAHGFIRDDAERALEFIAFVSLLAKLLDGAKRA
jgi:uncharacterized protein (TIGR02391 family)